MKATGIVRYIDDLGRVVIPKEIRRTLKIKEGDKLEIFTEEGGIICLKKYTEDPDFAEADKFVQKNMDKIACVFPRGKETEVIFTDGRRVTVKQNPNDKYNLSVAIVWAFWRAGFYEMNVGSFPEWCRD